MARFVLEGRTAVVWLASAPSSLAAPTQAELAAGVDLVGTKQAEELVEINGFEKQNNSIPTPGFAGLEVGNVAGEQTYPDSDMEWYKDDTSETIYDTVVDGAVGYVALCYDGLGDTLESEIYEVTVASRTRIPARNAAHRFRANFAISAPVLGTQAA